MIDPSDFIALSTHQLLAGLHLATEDAETPMASAIEATAMLGNVYVTTLSHIVVPTDAFIDATLGALRSLLKDAQRRQAAGLN